MKKLDCMDIYSDADFYELEFARRNHEVPFYLKYASLARGRVLEVACGTGRITLAIARTGILMTGLDVSAPMLKLGRRKADAEGLKITWLRQDCRKIRSNDRFALIFSATNAMQHLHDLESVNAFLESAQSILSPGGRLTIDVFNPDVAKLVRKHTNRYYHKEFIDGKGRKIRVEVASEYHSAKQILAFELYYLLGNKLVNQKCVKMRCFFPEELMALCESSGLKVIRRFGDYDESPFTDTSPKQITQCWLEVTHWVQA